MSSTNTQVAVLGAGITGMSAGLRLRELGGEFRIFEQLGHAGGHAITIRDSGFSFDRTGHLLHLRDEAMRTLALGWIGEDWHIVQRRSVVWSHGAYTRYPYQANTFGLPPPVAYDCLMGFFKAQLQTQRAAPRDFEQFCFAHFGEGISKHFMIPYNARLWGVHPREITAEWCSRFVPLPKLEDVVAGAVGLNDRELGYNTQFVYPRLGIGELTSGMARSLGCIQYNRAPIAIDAIHRKLVFDNETVDYQALISTAPLDQLCGLLAAPPAELSAAAPKLRCSRLYYLDVALNVPCGQPYHWVYVPEESYPFYRVGCYSHFSDALAPPGKSNLYIELADRSDPDLSQLVPEVAKALVEMGFISSPGEILFARKRKIDYAYVVFDHEYFQSVETIQRYLREHGILSTGRYGGWNYSSMEDALMFGRDAANSALELVR
jgi:protoporphyrinogen oxidase